MENENKLNTETSGLDRVLGEAKEFALGYMEKTGLGVLGAVVVVVHEDGETFISSQGVGPVSEAKLGLADALGKARNTLLREAVQAHKVESLSFLLDVAVVAEQR